jgi:hypothetical protein
MPNRIEAGGAKAQPNRHRETNVTAPVLDSTQLRNCWWRLRLMPLPGLAQPIEAQSPIGEGSQLQG